MEYNKKAGLIAVAGLILTTHCQADPLPQKDLDVYAPPQDAYVLDIPAGCPQPPVLNAAVVDYYPNPTNAGLQPFRGTASGAAMIVAKGGSGTAAPEKVQQDGSFCIEVPLIEDAQNTITFIPLDQRGCPGQTTVKTIQHQGAPKADGGVTAITNVAALANTTSSPVPEGSLNNVIDGDPETVAVVEFFDWDITGTCDKFAWIRFDLPKVYTISQINIDWGPDMGSNYASCFSVLVSTSETPGEPDPTKPAWKPLVEEQQGAAESQNRMVDPESARSVAVLLYEDGASGLTETFQIGEIQIMGRDPSAVPPPSPDHCK